MESSQIVQAALAKVGDLQSKLAPLLHKKLSFEIEESRAVYLSEAGELIEILFVPVCSFGIQSQTLQWAWANAGVSLPNGYNKTTFEKLSIETGFGTFQNPNPFPVTDDENRNLLALVIDYLNAYGVISEQYEQTIWSFVVTNINTDLDTITASEDQLSLSLYQIFDLDRVDLFNRLRNKYPHIKLDFTDADLRGDAQPWKGDLHGQLLFDIDYIKEHTLRVLDGINLSHCRLDGTILRDVSLKGASFKSSILINADLSRADLTNANLEGAFLNGANFSGATLKGVRIKKAQFGRTLLVDTDLSEIHGLDDTHHSTSSEISFNTLVKTGYKISESFMRAAGVSIGLIEDLRRGKRFGTTYATCFLSYSSKDRDLVQRIYYALMEAGVRVYWDNNDLLGGDYLDGQLVNAIKGHDRTITVFSENSLQSNWVLREVKAAMYYKPKGFTPISLCNIESIQAFVREHDVKPDIVDLYPIIDFTPWEQEGEFDRLIQKLLKSIRR